MIESTCPHCGGGSSFPDDKAGSEQTCPHCRKPVRLPSGAVPGFPGDVRKPAVSAPVFETGPAIQRRPAEVFDARPLPPVLNSMRRPPTEELHLCVFMKWFLLLVGCVATAAEIYVGARWYFDARRLDSVEWKEILARLLVIFGTFFGGIALYTIFACFGRIVGSLYLIGKNTETRK